MKVSGKTACMLININEIRDLHEMKHLIQEKLTRKISFIF